MSTLRTVNIQHISASTPAITLDSAGAITGSFPSPNRNLLYNGAMQINQRSSSVTGITTGNYYTLDRWIFNLGAQGTWTMDVQNDAPTGSGFRRSLRALCTSAVTPPATNGFLLISQKLEGQDLQRIAKGTSSAQQLCLSFWVKSNLTGTYIVEIEDQDNSRNVSSSYTITTSNTWERKTIVFPSDSVGIIDNDSNSSMQVNFWLSAGATFTSGVLATNWSSANNANRAVGQVNLAGSVNNYWQITGVQLETGSVATPFEFKSFGQELNECLRYYQKITTDEVFGILGVTGTAFNTTTIRAGYNVPVVLRSTPSSVEINQLAWIPSWGGGVTAISSASLVSGGQSRWFPLINFVTTGVTGNAWYMIVANNSTASFIAVSAEL